MALWMQIAVGVVVGGVALVLLPFLLVGLCHWLRAMWPAVVYFGVIAGVIFAGSLYVKHQRESLLSAPVVASGASASSAADAAQR